MTGRPAIDVAEHLQAMRRYARSLVGNRADADDLVQQSLLRAHERAATFRPGASLKAWLLAILHNQFVSDRRRAAAESRALDELGHRLDRPAEEGERGQAMLLRDVAARLVALSEDQRAVLHLIAVEGLSYRQAADALGVPIGTIMSRLSRARQALREPAPAEPAQPLRIVGGKDAD